MGGQLRWLLGMLVLLPGVSARADGPGDPCRTSEYMVLLTPDKESRPEYRTTVTNDRVPKDRCREKTPFSCRPAAYTADDRPRLCHQTRWNNLFAVCNQSARVFDSAGQDMGQIDFNRTARLIAPGQIGIMINLGSRNHAFPNNCPNDTAFGGRAVLTWRTPVVSGSDVTAWVCLKDLCAGEAANIDKWLIEDLPPVPNSDFTDYRQYKLTRVPQATKDSFNNYALNNNYCLKGGGRATDYLNNHDTMIGLNYNIPGAGMGSSIEIFKMQPGDLQPWVFHKPKKWIVKGKRVKLRNIFVNFVNCTTKQKKALEFWYGYVEVNGKKRFGWMPRLHIGTRIK